MRFGRNARLRLQAAARGRQLRQCNAAAQDCDNGCISSWEARPDVEAHETTHVVAGYFTHRFSCEVNTRRVATLKGLIGIDHATTEHDDHEILTNSPAHPSMTLNISKSTPITLPYLPTSG